MIECKKKISKEAYCAGCEYKKIQETLFKLNRSYYENNPDDLQTNIIRNVMLAIADVVVFDAVSMDYHISGVDTPRFEKPSKFLFDVGVLKYKEVEHKEPIFDNILRPIDNMYYFNEDSILFNIVEYNKYLKKHGDMGSWECSEVDHTRKIKATMETNETVYGGSPFQPIILPDDLFVDDLKKWILENNFVGGFVYNEEDVNITQDSHRFISNVLRFRKLTPTDVLVVLVEEDLSWN